MKISECLFNFKPHPLDDRYPDRSIAITPYMIVFDKDLKKARDFNVTPEIEAKLSSIDETVNELGHTAGIDNIDATPLDYGTFAAVVG